MSGPGINRGFENRRWDPVPQSTQNNSSNIFSKDYRSFSQQADHSSNPTSMNPRTGFERIHHAAPAAATPTQTRFPSKDLTPVHHSRNPHPHHSASSSFSMERESQLLHQMISGKSNYLNNLSQHVNSNMRDQTRNMFPTPSAFEDKHWIALRMHELKEQRRSPQPSPNIKPSLSNPTQSYQAKQDAMNHHQPSQKFPEQPQKQQQQQQQQQHQQQPQQQQQQQQLQQQQQQLQQLSQQNQSKNPNVSISFQSASKNILGSEDNTKFIRNPHGSSTLSNNYGSSTTPHKQATPHLLQQRHRLSSVPLIESPTKQQYHSSPLTRNLSSQNNHFQQNNNSPKSKQLSTMNYQQSANKTPEIFQDQEAMQFRLDSNSIGVSTPPRRLDKITVDLKQPPNSSSNNNNNNNNKVLSKLPHTNILDEYYRQKDTQQHNNVNFQTSNGLDHQQNSTYSQPSQHVTQSTGGDDRANNRRQSKNENDFTFRKDSLILRNGQHDVTFRKQQGQPIQAKQQQLPKMNKSSLPTEEAIDSLQSTTASDIAGTKPKVITEFIRNNNTSYREKSENQLPPREDARQVRMSLDQNPKREINMKSNQMPQYAPSSQDHSYQSKDSNSAQKRVALSSIQNRTASSLSSADAPSTMFKNISNTLKDQENQGPFLSNPKNVQYQSKGVPPYSNNKEFTPLKYQPNQSYDSPFNSKYQSIDYYNDAVNNGRRDQHQQYPNSNSKQIYSQENSNPISPKFIYH